MLTAVSHLIQHGCTSWEKDYPSKLYWRRNTCVVMYRHCYTWAILDSFNKLVWNRRFITEGHSSSISAMELGLRKSSALCETGIWIKLSSGMCKMKWGDTGISNSSCSSHHLDWNFSYIFQSRFSLKHTEISCHHSNYIFFTSVLRLTEVSERCKGFWRGECWGEKIINLKMMK